MTSGNRNLFDPKGALTKRNGSSNPRSATSAGILAGQVIDGYDRKVGSAVIRVVSGDAPLTGSAAPIDIERTANREGYFTIPNLTPGKTYQLIARVDYRGRVFSGATTARAPDPRVLIRLTEEKPLKGGGITPPPDPAKEAEPATAIQPDPPSDNGIKEDQGGTPGREPFTPPVPGGASIFEKQPKLDRTIEIPRIRKDDTSGIVPRREVPVPSCARLGKTVRSFALKDLNGKAWVYPRDSQGRLTLLDFWRPGCLPCYRASPFLSQLQRDYGHYGLEVVGIACEQSPSPQRENAVTQVLSRHPMQYRILMNGYRSANRPCPVQVQLAVQRFPTLMLLDDRGTIIWRSEGLGQREQAELVRTIQQHLRKR